MTLDDFETEFGPLPSQLDRAKFTSLLKKSENKFPLVPDLLGDVTAWLTATGVQFTKTEVPYTSLTGDALHLAALDLQGKKPVRLLLVDDYNRFNKKVVDKLTATNVHLAQTKAGHRPIWVKKFEWENLNKRAVLQSLITHLMGLTPNRVFARNTVAERASNTELRAFFDASSFYGYRHASSAVVLRDKSTGEVLQAMSFGHPFYGKDKYGENCVECIRSAGKRNTVVVGGMSKLMKFYVEEFADDFESILYYVDDAHHSAASMGALGFTFSHMAQGGVHNVFPRTGAMMMRTPALHKEIMHAQKVGFIMGIPDVGNSTFVFRKGTEIGSTPD